MDPKFNIFGDNDRTTLLYNGDLNYGLVCYPHLGFYSNQPMVPYSDTWYYLVLYSNHCPN